MNRDSPLIQLGIQSLGKLNLLSICAVYGFRTS